MRKKSLKEHYAGAQVANMINDIMIEKSLDRLENYELDEKQRAEEVALLRRGLECRNNFHGGEVAYNVVQAKKKGYIVGWASASVGAIIGVVGPTAIVAIKEHLANRN